MGPLRYCKKTNAKIDFVGEPHRGLPVRGGHSGPPLRKLYMAEDLK